MQSLHTDYKYHGCESEIYAENNLMYKNKSHGKATQGKTTCYKGGKEH